MFRGPGRVGGVGRPGRPVAALATGMIVGGAIAGRRAESRAEQQQMQAQQQAQLNQAQAEAAAAQQQASMAYAQPVQAQAVVVQPPSYGSSQPSAASPDVGRQMLGEALTGQPDVERLIALKKQLNVVQIMCDQALGLYQQSMQLTKKAGRTNTTGAVVNVALRGTRGVDYALDAKRDAETKAATQPAEKASAMLVEGFKQIPNELRTRYPVEMSRVGDVPAASLKVGSFGKSMLVTAAFGEFGNAMNDMSMARKIRENEEELAACIRIVSEQKNLMQVVQARLDADINKARSASATPPVSAAPPAAAALPPPPPAITSAPPQQYLELTSAHIVDENSPVMQQHQIISVPAGAMVTLVRGTLQGGLGAPYQDYVEVQYNGRLGKISRLVVRPASFGVPPPIM